MSAARTRTFEWQDPMITAAAVDGKSGLAYLRTLIDGAVPQPPISFALGFALVAAEEGFARFRGVPAEYHYNPMGAVHGGYACTLLDSAMGCAVMTTLDEKGAYTTSQLSIQLVRPITIATGPVLAEGRIVHRGSRVATAEGKLVDEAGKLLAHATTTCLILPR
jgi:uncharacterized protein (TIGR00369 family)